MTGRARVWIAEGNLARSSGTRKAHVPNPILWAMSVLVTAILASPGIAQELSPRAYWPAPKGTSVLVVGYAHSTGDVVVDPSLPVTGVDSTVNRSQLGFVHTTSLAGRTANLVLEVPFAWGSTTGTLDGQPARRDFSGVGDLAGTVSLNLLGAPSMTPMEFQELRKKPRPILAASLKIVAPTGYYEADKLINVSANRWAFKAELGQIIPLKPKLLLELELGAWVLGDNDDFLGATREQDPIYALEAHLVKRIDPGRWASLEVNFYRGGQTTVDGVRHDDLQRNSTVGASFAWTFAGRHALKASLSTGVVTESGGDYLTALISYMVRVK